MTLIVLAGLAGMLAVAAWPTREERRRWAAARDERRSVHAHDRFVRDLRPTPRHHKPGTAR